jgi:hypothetical protein
MWRFELVFALRRMASPADLERRRPLRLTESEQKRINASDGLRLIAAFGSRGAAIHHND